MTVTVTIRDAETRERGGWFHQRLVYLADRLKDVVYGPQTSPDCVPRLGDKNGVVVTLPTPKATAPLDPLDLRSAPGIIDPPKVRF
jgi:hypothetical protein